MSATRDNASYAPKSPDLSSFYPGPEARSTPARHAHYAFQSPGVGEPASPGAYHAQWHPALAQAQAHAQAQAPSLPPHLEPGTHRNFDQSPPHYYHYQAQHYNNRNHNSNSAATTNDDSPAAATIANRNHNHNHSHSLNHNHSPHHLLPQQYPPFAAYSNSHSHTNHIRHNSLNHHSNHAPNALAAPYHHQQGVQYYPQQSQPQQQPQVQPQPQPQPQPQYSPSQLPAYQPQAPSYYPSYPGSPASTSYAAPDQSFSQPQQQPPPPPQQPQPQQPEQPLAFDQAAKNDTGPPAMPRGKAVAQVAKEPDIMESPVRTKFPTARIKRIMQADEEVGKVAQQTPIAVGKALELFMVQLVHRSAEVAKEKNSKRITAPMLKQAIDSTNEWDFLRDIVAKVTEEKEAAKVGGRAKAESDSDEEADVGEVKKKARGGRKKKAV
ncbi:hypothetical protein F4808DRAFT_464585 [Astrocystis sublimbata]|nr:hypothetical protein F4808DRAFT_464585 [Astrocystis sublimbata]